MPHAVDHHAILDRLAAMRGVGNVFAVPDPARTAHVIVDLQNGFMQVGAPVEVPMARHIVDEVNLVSRAVREAGGTNIFLRYTTPPDWENQWTVFWERMGPAAAGHREAFTPGHPMHDLWAGLDVRPDDLVVDKHRFSGFFPGTSTLPDVLRDRGINTLIISGTLTNCCCESTARDAMQAGYRVIMAADANAALTDEEHGATLHILAFVFADLLSAKEIAALWQA
ncbi:cysteine hydrolase family protein [Alteraurantiacibacter buctensis]|uniref:Isochorismatase family protein n=1 Tax=Alteraurantiacibacter buctensis TaxID=1503981 RepID=A0A844Z180_9SPHN|nr:cysteine hydrolase [Alteraurantiacibacter buctensis]MXO72187.1 isochorismatase family protein [Alteraurantiacibacter buctensis]